MIDILSIPELRGTKPKAMHIFYFPGTRDYGYCLHLADFLGKVVIQVNK